MADDLEKLQDLYHKYKQTVSELEPLAAIRDLLDSIPNFIPENLKKYGASLQLKRDTQVDVVSVEDAMEKLLAPAVDYNKQYNKLRKIEAKLSEHPDDRILVNERKMWIGDIAFVTIPPKFEVTYLDETTNTKKTDLWLAYRVVKWHQDRGLEPPAKCKEYMSL